MFLSEKHIVSLYCRSITVYFFATFAKHYIRMGQFENRNILKIVRYICPHFACRKFGRLTIRRFLQDYITSFNAFRFTLFLK